VESGSDKSPLAHQPINRPTDGSRQNCAVRIDKTLVHDGPTTRGSEFTLSSGLPPAGLARGQQHPAEVSDPVRPRRDEPMRVRGLGT
jgi:hypothetical protein